MNWVMQVNGKTNIISKGKKLVNPKAIDYSYCEFKYSINFDESYRNEVY